MILRKQTLGSMALVVLAAVSISASSGSAPVVVSASVPLYPDQARIAALEGTVKLTVETDGERVVRVLSKDGQPLLANAAEENLRTWVFKPHKPTRFDVQYIYKLSAKPSCELGTAVVTLYLPTSVELTAPHFQTCDPALLR